MQNNHKYSYDYYCWHLFTHIKYNNAFIFIRFIINDTVRLYFLYWQIKYSLNSKRIWILNWCWMKAFTSKILIIVHVMRNERQLCIENCVYGLKSINVIRTCYHMTWISSIDYPLFQEQQLHCVSLLLKTSSSFFLQVGGMKKY